MNSGYQLRSNQSAFEDFKEFAFNYHISEFIFFVRFYDGTLQTHATIRGQQNTRKSLFNFSGQLAPFEWSGLLSPETEFASLYAFVLLLKSYKL